MKFVVKFVVDLRSLLRQLTLCLEGCFNSLQEVETRNLTGNILGWERCNFRDQHQNNRTDLT